ncbi:MAG: acylphosphatase, partial [Methanobacteriota archaeon]
VGYRLFLLEKADELTIEKMEVKNTKIDGKEAVLILLEDERGKIVEFISRVERETPEFSEVEKVKAEDYPGEVKDIERFRAALNTSQLSKIVQGGLQLIQEVRKLGGKMDQTREELGSKIELVGEKVDQTREELGSKIELVGEKVDQTREELGRELRETRKGMIEEVQTEMREMREEISKIREALRNAGILV